MFTMVQKRAENRKECRQYDELSHQSFVARQNESSPCLREWDSLAMYKRIQIVHLTLSDETWAIVISLFFFFILSSFSTHFQFDNWKLLPSGQLRAIICPIFGIQTNRSKWHNRIWIVFGSSLHMKQNTYTILARINSKSDNLRFHPVNNEISVSIDHNVQLSYDVDYY